MAAIIVKPVVAGYVRVAAIKANLTLRSCPTILDEIVLQIVPHRLVHGRASRPVVVAVDKENGRRRLVWCGPRQCRWSQRHGQGQGAGDGDDQNERQTDAQTSHDSTSS